MENTISVLRDPISRIALYIDDTINNEMTYLCPSESNSDLSIKSLNISRFPHFHMNYYYSTFAILPRWCSIYMCLVIPRVTIKSMPLKAT